MTTETFHDGLMRFLPELTISARRLTRDRSSAEDLVQDTVVRALKGQGRFQPGTNLRAWLYTILRNGWIETCRRSRPHVSLDQVPAAASVGGAPQHAVVELGEVSRAMRTLSGEQRETLGMIAGLGFSYEEAARASGCPVGTVKSRLSRARKHLEGELGMPPMLASSPDVLTDGAHA